MEVVVPEARSLSPQPPDMALSVTTKTDRGDDLHLDDAPAPEDPTSPTMTIVCRQAKEHTSSTVSLYYLAEGAANVVFSIRASREDHYPFEFASGHDGSSVYPRSQFLGHILRVGKGLDKTLSGDQVKEEFDSEISPLFYDGGLAKHLMPLQTVMLDAEVVAHLNEEIKSQSRRKVQIKEHQATTVGLLMQDMSPVPGESLTIEIKPKWLAQSPTAPKNAYRCRTCALQALKNRISKSKSKDKDNDKESKGPGSALDNSSPPRRTDADDAYICPLKLCTGNADVIRPYIRHKVLEASAYFPEPLDHQIETQITDSMTTYFTTGEGHRLMKHLQNLQLEHDSEGVLERKVTAENSEEAARFIQHLDPSRNEIHKEEFELATLHINKLKKFDHGLRLAMTLRDCSLYVKAAYVGDIVVESKLGDLDFKSDAKIKDWEGKELQLINGLYYKGADVDHDERNYREDCSVAEDWRRRVPRYW